MNTQSAIALALDDRWADLLTQCMSASSMRILTPNCAEEAEEVLQKESSPIFLCRSSDALADEGRLLKHVRQWCPSVQILLCVDTDIRKHYKTFAECKVGALIPADSPPNAQKLSFFIACFLDPPASLGLSRYLSAGADIQNCRILSLQDKQRAVEAIWDFVNQLEGCAHSSFDTRLVLEELVTNSLLHGFRKKSGERKYTPNHFSTLGAAEHIDVEFGIDAAGWFGLSVTDNGGSLDTRQVHEKLGRQFSMAGLKDENGRGFFLAHALSTEVAVTVIPGAVTQVCALFSSTNPEAGKSLYLFQPAASFQKIG